MALTATAIGLIGLVLSWGMRLQLAFPETFSFLGPCNLLSICHYAWNDYGDLSSYRFVFRRFW